MYIEVEQEHENKLSRELWRFWVCTDIKLKIVFDRYLNQSRPTTRHKYRNEQVYSRCMSRDCTIKLDELVKHKSWDDVQYYAALKIKKLIDNTKVEIKE